MNNTYDGPIHREIQQVNNPKKYYFILMKWATIKLSIMSGGKEVDKLYLLLLLVDI